MIQGIRTEVVRLICFGSPRDPEQGIFLPSHYHIPIIRVFGLRVLGTRPHDMVFALGEDAVLTETVASCRKTHNRDVLKSVPTRHTACLGGLGVGNEFGITDGTCGSGTGRALGNLPRAVREEVALGGERYGPSAFYYSYI